MARVQVILHGIPGGTIHDTDDYPVILQFSENKSYEEAEWVIPSYPGYIPADMLSEIRVVEGEMSVVVDGPAGFQSGPHHADWIRGAYPRGKLCAFLDLHTGSGKMGGVTVEVEAGQLVVAELALGGPPAPS